MSLSLAGRLDGVDQPFSPGLPQHGDAAAEDAVHRERERLEALERYDVLDTPREEAFDRIARLTQKVFQVPIATISLLDGHRQWFKSAQGLEGSEAPRQDTFCHHAIQQSQPLVVPDAARDSRFERNPYVAGEPHIRFYAGIPLRTKDGHNIGTLCAIDTRPRELDAGQLEILSDLARIATDELELRLLATTDGLTGALSRRAFREEAERAVALALRHHQDLSCVALDLDRFKSINDAYGHPSGDKVLVETVRACTDHLRQSDVIGRLGGEEFAALLPNTGPKGALDVAERLRGAIKSLRFDFGPPTFAVTASFGVASLDAAVRNVETLLRNADAALYEAKAAGRNRCVAWRTAAAATGAGRRRVLKAGQILFNGRMSSIDCTVRSLSDEGAGLDVSSSVGVPRRFDLSIKADRFEKCCQVLSQTERHIDVAFC